MSHQPLSFKRALPPGRDVAAALCLAERLLHQVRCTNAFVGRGLRLVWGRWTLWVLLCIAAAPAHAADNLELLSLQADRQEGAPTLSFAVQHNLGRTVENALQRGVPVTFVAEASLYRHRWYWRNEKIAQVSRSWRLSYQPLTSNWRVRVGAFSQSVPTLSEALSRVGRMSSWKLAEADQMEPGVRYEVEFVYRIDDAQLPRIWLLDLGAQTEWKMSVERTVKVAE